MSSRPLRFTVRASFAIAKSVSAKALATDQPSPRDSYSFIHFCIDNGTSLSSALPAFPSRKNRPLRPKAIDRINPSKESTPANRCREQRLFFSDCLTDLMVGTGRFELPTPRTPSECSTRLSHVPTQSSRLVRAGFRGPIKCTPARPCSRLWAVVQFERYGRQRRARASARTYIEQN